MADYQKFYDLEKFLLSEVGPKFCRSGEIEPLDFFLILHWKAPRAKTKHRDRLKAKEGSFEQAVSRIAKDLFKATNAEQRLKALILNWTFRLPTATAILAVLYPDEFTIYDVRVREQLGRPALPDTCSETRWSDFWKSYKAFECAVVKETPRGLKLRDKDRYLWGKSLYEEAEDCWRA
ncbi:MAG: hypothetical protein J0H40_10350 [Rhizobiales bacterium]|nr:hypothetical protein [Hyphomicrobiales bacterium]